MALAAVLAAAVAVVAPRSFAASTEPSAEPITILDADLRVHLPWIYESRVEGPRIYWVVDNIGPFTVIRANTREPAFSIEFTWTGLLRLEPSDDDCRSTGPHSCTMPINRVMPSVGVDPLLVVLELNGPVNSSSDAVRARIIHFDPPHTYVDTDPGNDVSTCLLPASTSLCRTD